MYDNNATFFEAGYDIVPDQLNINIGTGGAALAGIYISLRNYERAYCVILNPAGTDGDDLVITPLQSTSIAGTVNKALTFSRFWIKAGTTVVLSDTIATWRQIDLTTPSSALNFNSVVGNVISTNGIAGIANSPTDMAIETIENVVVVEFRADSLDVSNNYSFIKMTFPAVGAASTKTVRCLWLLKGARYPQGIPLSVLA